MTRRIVTHREQAAMATPWQREASPWHAQEGDPTYQVPTSDLLRHRQFNPAITTPQQMRRNLYQPTAPGEPLRRTYDYESDFSSGGGDEGSNNGESLAEAFESGQAHKLLPPTEVVTNGSHALLSDGNHRAEMADTFSHPELSSYIHYDPHAYSSDLLGEPVDPESGLGKHIDNLVQNHPYEPVEGGPTTDAVFKRHPQTQRWQRGIVDHTKGPVDMPEGGTGFHVDFGNGPELTHERHLHARFEREAMASYEEYAGHHSSPGPGTGWPVHEMTNVDGELGGVPEDWYTHPHYYSSGASDGGSAADMKATQKLYNDMRGKPDHPVTVYRALPHGNTDFNTGDWVTPSLNYAKQHAIQSDNPAEDWPVIKTTVPAKHLFQNGDSYDEFGYHGPSHAGGIV